MRNRIMCIKSYRRRASWIRTVLVCLGVVSWPVSECRSAGPAAVPDELKPWLVPQHWHRDTDGPVISLGRPPAFDDTHVFAPCVACQDGLFMLWYSGSPGTVAQRVFSLGLATSRDGKRFDKHKANPVCGFGDGKHSILTATLLRNPDGSVLREEGKLRMWFSSTHFAGQSNLHTLHETTSTDGVRWSPPSPPLTEHVYGPTIIKQGHVYRLWYTDVSADPWVIGHATSRDGRSWKTAAEPVLGLDQNWESHIVLYPTVLMADGVYLMWYGSYWSVNSPETAPGTKTAIGFAASLDGLKWYKSAHNPVLRPDPDRPWESNYTTSQSVLRLPDGSWRIWYASRKKPPFVNKYFAINTATWPGPALPPP